MAQLAKAVKDNKLSGIWRTDYTYFNSDKQKNMQSVHYVRFYPKRNGFVLETVPGANESYMIARFYLDGNIATGTWQEGTSPKGDYKGVMYHGAGQLILSDDHRNLNGKWVGFGKNMEVKTGPWEFNFLGDDESVLDKLEKATGQ